MKISKSILILSVLLLIVGCLSPIVSAKSKTSFIAKAKGIGTVEIGTNVYLAQFEFVGEVFSTGDRYFEGPVKVVLQFVLPDGTKISRLTEMTFRIGLDDNDDLQMAIGKYATTYHPIDSYFVDKKAYGVLHADLQINNDNVQVDLILRLSPGTTSGGISSSTDVDYYT